MVSSYARTKEASQAKYISILNIIQGEVDPTQVILSYIVHVVAITFSFFWFEDILFGLMSEQAT